MIGGAGCRGFCRAVSAARAGLTGDARDGTDAQLSIDMVRAFVQLRDIANTHQGLGQRLDALEDKTEALAMSHDTFSRNTRNQLRQYLKHCVSLPRRLIHHLQPNGPSGFYRCKTNPRATMRCARRRPTDALAPAQKHELPGTRSLLAAENMQVENA